jgi:hypothetical protein
MATFYVMPSRRVLGQRFADMLSAIGPGAKFVPSDWPELAETLAGVLQQQRDVHVVFREDLDEEMSVKDSLVQHFGADLKDEIVEVRFGADLHHILHQRWSA